MKKLRDLIIKKVPLLLMCNAAAFMLTVASFARDFTSPPMWEYEPKLPESMRNTLN